MTRRLLGMCVLFVLFGPNTACGQHLAEATDPVERELEDILLEQVAAWNRGDLDAFMQHYWKSEQLSFSSGGTTHRGWQNTYDRYQKRYPTKEKMGRLTFDAIEVSRLGDAAAMVLGDWQLTRADDELGGNFSLIFREINGAWVIVHDHTSVREKDDDH